jgi:hypothetical protein
MREVNPLDGLSRFGNDRAELKINVFEMRLHCREYVLWK